MVERLPFSSGRFSFGQSHIAVVKKNAPQRRFLCGLLQSEWLQDWLFACLALQNGEISTARIVKKAFAWLASQNGEPSIARMVKKAFCIGWYCKMGNLYRRIV